ncbi:MAG: hypothetical protein QOJ51_3524 [Acidobacteriaceae bacterium]|jgi:hypothetical protein|nr:hypothetical protein [Acidobacteriaceae bacterium]
MSIALLGNKTDMRRKAGALVLTAAALAFSSLSQPARAQGESGLREPIEGTWILQIHRVTQNFTFTALQSFTAGGVTLATGTADRTPPPPISPLYGTWKRIGENSYATSLSFFIFDGAGNAVAMLQNYETFHLNAGRRGADDEIVGTGEAYVCKPNGDNCVNINSPITFSGKLMNAQHL